VRDAASKQTNEGTIAANAATIKHLTTSSLTLNPSPIVQYKSGSRITRWCACIERGTREDGSIESLVR